MVAVNVPKYRQFVGKTPAQITKGNLTVIPSYTSTPELIDIISKADDEDAVVLGENYTVKGTEAHRFKRNEDVLRIAQETPAYRAIEERLNPVGSIQRAFSENESSIHRGYGWIGRGRNLRVVPLLYAVEGAELAALEKNNIKVKRYNDRIAGTVPSRSEDKKHTVTLGGIPFSDLGEKVFAEWLNLRSQSTVEAQQWYGALAQTRANDEVLFTPEDIAAYHSAVQRFCSADKPALNPFVIPSTKLAKFMEKLRNNVIVLYNAANKEPKMRNLNGTEKELLLWSKTLYSSGNWIIDNTPKAVRDSADYLLGKE